MKVEIEIDMEIPTGYKLVRFGFAKQGDWVLELDDLSVHEWRLKRGSVNEYFILEKVVKQGRDLVGCLCGLSDESLEIAKYAAEELCVLGAVFNYVDESEFPYAGADCSWKFAYPVAEEDIKKFLTEK